MAVRTYISIITLNVNGLNAPNKRHRLAMDTKTRPIYMQSTRNPFTTSRHILIKLTKTKHKKEY